jgi:hypothetical protein
MPPKIWTTPPNLEGNNERADFVGFGDDSELSKADRQRSYRKPEQANGKHN